MTLLTLLYIALACNYLSDWSNLPNDVDYWFFYKFHYRNVPYQSGKYIKKPFTCSGCSTLHITWIYLLCSGHTNIFEIGLLSLTGAALATIISKVYYKFL